MCVIKLFVGLPCPGCGLLDALWAAVQGGWGEAFSLFPLWPMVPIFFLFFRRSRPAGELFVGLLFLQWVVRIGLIWRA